jgi:hypothetical protein
MDQPSAPEEFHPQLISRRGELIAWASALMVLAGWFILRQSRQAMLPVVPILAILLLLAALSISLGNWVDRNTYIRLENGGITFNNGLRHAHFKWDQIRRVEVTPSKWGKKVEVLGDQAHFGFRTLGEVEAYGNTIGRVGFENGEWILEHILERSGLQAKHQ